MPSASHQIFQPNHSVPLRGGGNHVRPILGWDAVAVEPRAHVHDGQAEVGSHRVQIVIPDHEGGLKVHVRHDTPRIGQINPFCITPRYIVRGMDTTPADRLRKARIAAGFTTAEEAATSRAWKPAGYRHHENGSREFFDIENVLRYARAFKVDPAWIMGLSEAQAEARGELNAAALGQVIEALLQAYAPSKRMAPAELLGLGEALKETIDEMMDDPDVGSNPDRAAFVAKAVVRARRRVGQ